jgi:hypothetical protein
MFIIINKFAIHIYKQIVNKKEERPTKAIEIKEDAAQQDQDKPKPNQRHQIRILKISTRMQMQVSLCFHNDCLSS